MDGNEGDVCVADAGLVLKAILGASERSAVRRRLRTGIRCAAVTWAAQFIISTYLRDKQLFPQGRQKLSIEEFQAMHPRKYIQRNVSNQALRAPHCWQPVAPRPGSKAVLFDSLPAYRN